MSATLTSPRSVATNSFGVGMRATERNLHSSWTSKLDWGRLPDAAASAAALPPIPESLPSPDGDALTCAERHWASNSITWPSSVATTMAKPVAVACTSTPTGRLRVPERAAPPIDAHSKLLGNDSDGVISVPVAVVIVVIVCAPAPSAESERMFTSSEGRDSSGMAVSSIDVAVPLAADRSSGTDQTGPASPPPPALLPMSPSKMSTRRAAPTTSTSVSFALPSLSAIDARA
mmetsp:Transcript_46229/g.142566  ORF Transcript_46229/g.142566 Transcript_46229/m.142566 type:complete len:232 (-) Transcript_46229:211-906(-)